MDSGNRILQIALTIFVVALFVIVTFHVADNADKGTDDNPSECAGPIINENYLCSHNYEVNDSATGSWLKGTILFYDMGDHLEATVIAKFYVNNNPCLIFGLTQDQQFEILSLDTDFREDYTGKSIDCYRNIYNSDYKNYILYFQTGFGYNGDGTAIMKIRSIETLEHGARQASFFAGFYNPSAGGQFEVDLPEWGS